MASSLLSARRQLPLFGTVAHTRAAEWAETPSWAAWAVGPQVHLPDIPVMQGYQVWPLKLEPLLELTLQ